MTRTLWLDDDGRWHTTLRGRQILSDPRLNRGTAFSYGQRHALGLTGLVPPAQVTLEQQVARVYAQYLRQPSDLAKNVLLREIQDRNEVLFYRLLITHLTEMLPIVYTPTIGQAIKSYSHEYRRPRGVYLSVDHPDLIEESLRDTGLDGGDVDLIVATDAGAILGIGDWGVGGIHIAVGKLAVYTAAGGIDPDRALPVMLDVGTDRQSLLDDPLYIGNRRSRVSPAEYDNFLDAFVDAVARMFPRAMLHWEDIGLSNARRLLDRYHDRLLTFNDDIQGTGAVNLAAVLAAVRATGTQLADHRVVIFGAGTAGTGIADQLRAQMLADGLPEPDARNRFWAIDRAGLLTTDMPDLSGPQRRCAREPAEVAEWDRDPGGRLRLAEVVRRVRPTILIGTSTRAGAFTETIVKLMASQVARPVILPMSNPTELAEATPADLIAWTDGRALVATGSPFEPVLHDGVRYEIGQANNALVFPGIGLGVIAAQASRVTDGMLAAAAHAVASLTDSSARGAALLPPVSELRDTSVAVAVAVALAAEHDNVAGAMLADDLAQHVAGLMWEPSYRPIVPE
ncbi:MAG TPA: NAD-dependent malic enzyme [Streptosporangiaceae bacterium]|jgi:malate dehydrogenase (oxaloacetate-decarboxylating)|nr:NAD-dependent malic enzyme [Streptosporangiaceae bacterium]